MRRLLMPTAEELVLSPKFAKKTEAVKAPRISRSPRYCCALVAVPLWLLPGLFIPVFYTPELLVLPKVLLDALLPLYPFVPAAPLLLL
jgi:hypothetical protein